MVDHSPANDPTIVFQQKKKRFNLRDFCKNCLSALGRWCHFKNPPSPFKPSESPSPLKEKEELQELKFEIINVALEEIEVDSEEESTMNGVDSLRLNSDSIRGSPKGFYKHKSTDNVFPKISSPLSRKPSSRSPSPIPSFVERSKSTNRPSFDSSANGFPPSLSRNPSRSTTPIMFSNSTGLMKPPAIQKHLECTLEELCYGCKKKIKVTRDVLAPTGKVTQEEEILTIKVKPGWKQGTKITFEGMGNEKPGTCPADITFVIQEKRHPLFRRVGDELEIAVEIPLVKALTGCDISIPQLGGGTTSLSIDDIIYPGYEVAIPEQGMPITKIQGKRGDLKVVFLVDFPVELTQEKRLQVVSILEDSSLVD